MKKTFVLAFSALLLCVGCLTAQLTPGGTNVEYVTKQEAPKAYKLLGDVSFGGLEGGSSVQDTIVRMRNKTAEMGGDFLVIDVIEKHYNDQGGQWYTGNGRAYKK